MKGRSLVATLLVVGLLAGGLLAGAGSVQAEGTEEVVKPIWVDGVAFEGVMGADRTGDYGRISVGDTGKFGMIMTTHSNFTADGVNRLVDTGEFDSASAFSLNTSVATVSSSGTTEWDVEGHEPGRVTILVQLVDGDDEYIGATSVEVVSEELDQDTTEDTEHEQHFADIDIAPAIIVMIMIVVSLALAVIFRTFISFVIAVIFVAFASLWFVGLVSIMVVVSAWIISLLATLVEVILW